MHFSSCASPTRGISGGIDGSNNYTNNIDYVTYVQQQEMQQILVIYNNIRIQLHGDVNNAISGFASGGGSLSPTWFKILLNILEIATLGNVDFGDLTMRMVVLLASPTRALCTLKEPMHHTLVDQLMRWIMFK